MNRWILTSLLAMMVLVGAYSAQAASLPISIDRFRFDNVDLVENATNRLDIQRNNEYTVEVTFSAPQELRNLQVQIFASGFEYSDTAPIEAQSRLFDAYANTTYVRRFTLRLTDRVERDDYKIRVLFSDRDNGDFVKNYNVKFDVPRHSIKVDDVVFYPAGAVQAGNALLTTVRLENQGEKSEDDVRVEISIPALGISGIDYVDQIRAGATGNREKGTEEIFMRIPDCAKAGTYDVIVKVLFNQLHDSVTSKAKMDVIENPVCQARKDAESKPKAPETVVVYRTGMPPANGSVAINVQPPVQDDKAPDSISRVRDGLEIFLFLLIALLVIVAMVIAFRGLNHQDD